VLALCDGTREDSRALGAALAIRFGLPIDTGSIEGLLQALDEALLLDNERHRDARQVALSQYREASFRPPALAGPSYPAEPDELRRLLTRFGEDNLRHSVSGGAHGFGRPSPPI